MHHGLFEREMKRQLLVQVLKNSANNVPGVVVSCILQGDQDRFDFFVLGVYFRNSKNILRILEIRASVPVRLTPDASELK